MSDTGSATVSERREGEYRVYLREGGEYYWDLFQRFQRGETSARRLNNHAKERDVYLIEDAGRKFVLKRDRGGWGFGGESRIERFVLKLFRGPFYSRLMRRVRLACSQGCDVVQDIHLVAERRTLHYCHEAVMLLDYIEGDLLGYAEKEASAYYPEVLRAMLTLHRHGLALCDVSFYNFLVTDGGIRIIDLVCRGNRRVDQIKDAVRMKKVFGIDMPVEGWLNRFLFRFLARLQARRQRYADAKRRRRTPNREKYFRTHE